MVYISIFYFSGIAEQQNNVTPVVASNLYTLGTPSGTNFFGNIVSNVVAVWNYMLVFIKMVFLWNGTLWQGNWLWFYYVICLPVVIGMVFSIVTILRGVHDS
jgi:hypothetical protein